MRSHLHEEQVDLSTVATSLGRIVGKSFAHVERLRIQTGTNISVDFDSAVARVRGPVAAGVRAACCELELRRLHLEQEQVDTASDETGPERLRLETMRDVCLLQVPNARTRGQALVRLLHAVSRLRQRDDESTLALLGEVREHLVAALDSPDPDLLLGALQCLGRMRDPLAVAPMLPFLQAPELVVRAAAVEGLSALGVAEAVEAAEDLLRCEHPAAQLVGVKAVGRAARAEAAPLVVAVLEQELAKGGRAWKVLVGSASDALGRLGDPGAIPALLQVARQVAGCRSKAVRALMNLDPSAVAPALVDLLSDPGASLRLAVLDLVRKADYRVALPAVRTLLADEGSARVRGAALDLLADWKDRGSLESVRRMAFHDPSALYRHRAVRALAELAGEEGQADLQRLESDPNPQVRRTARALLGVEAPRPPAGLRGLLTTGLRRLVAGFARRAQ